MSAVQVNVSLERLTQALETSWSAETSAATDWSTAVPARGQCAVSALIIQEEFGGELVRAMVAGESHYWNRLPDGSEVDATRSQFEVFDPVGVAVRLREYVLLFPETQRRYELLRLRVERDLVDHV